MGHEAVEHQPQSHEGAELLNHESLISFESPPSTAPANDTGVLSKVRFSTDIVFSAHGDGDEVVDKASTRPVRIKSAAPSALRKRDRGYSLRRSLFFQNVQRHVNETDSAIELQNPATCSAPSRTPAGSPKRETTVSASELTDDGSASPFAIFPSHDGRPPMSRQFLPSRSSSNSVLNEIKRALVEGPQYLFKAKPLPPSANGRYVRLNLSPSVSPIDERTNKPHIDNLIISCRYTPANFFPRQLVAQFGKLANFYFLCVSILQMIPGLSTTGTYTTIIPLLIFVGISMSKEAYDDIRRHKLDKEENERLVNVLESRKVEVLRSVYKTQEGPDQMTVSNDWCQQKWQNVRVGNVVLLERDAPIPADVILLHVAESRGSAYIETKSLDGETNLKIKRPLSALSKQCSSVDRIARLEAEFVVEDPNIDLYKFNGKVIISGETLPLTNAEIIYRGSVLRNTTSATAIVIYSGEECKIRMNANKSPRVKAPTLQRLVNNVVVFIAGLVLFIAILMTGLYQVWHRSTEEQSFYIQAAAVPLGHVLTSFIIMFNTMLPLSLYVSLEIVKIAQMLLMNDIDMYDPESDTPIECHTSTINEELGQVSYIFSDKTGTLTNNFMKFRKMSVAGMAFDHDFDLEDESLANRKPKLSHKKRSNKGKNKATSRTSQRFQAPKTSATGSVFTPASQGPKLISSDLANDQIRCGTTSQLLDYMEQKPQTAFARKAKLFILGLALCHTCTPEKDDEGKATFHATSPDEVALVTAALDMGYIVTDRQTHSITVKTHPYGEDDDPSYDTYQVLDVIEFSSTRKRMSILIRMPDDRICLFTKGADTTVRKLLRLVALAESAATDVQNRASQRKSMEAQEVLRRKSIQIQSQSGTSRSSFTVRRPSGIGRTSSISIDRRRSIRESIDLWLKDKESDVGPSILPRNSFMYTPRASVQQHPAGHSGTATERPSFAHAESGSVLMQKDTEVVMGDAVAMSDDMVFERCFQHIDDFATEGLRTLLYGYKIISEHDYNKWRDVYAQASTSLVDRQQKMDAAGELIEQQLELLGATAIEDKLQEGVPDAIDRLRRASIKIWMLTGDKRETAVNIGRSCRLIKDYSTVVVLDHESGSLAHRITDAAAIFTSGRIAHSVLVIDGQTLTLVDADPVAAASFTDLAIKADSVICCRASPSQKAALVKSVRLRVKGSVTLAIGDGANDIAMIQEAHLGIGIAGKEGLQAARTSDYSIAQFRFLLKLLLVHGRWNYVRICKYTLGTFWKETLFYLVQAMYQRWNGYSGTSLYEPWSLSMFNTLFTSLPVIFMGVFEKDLAASTLLAVPELYSIGQKNQGFNFKLYVYWAFLGAIEAVTIYFIMYSIYGEALFTRDQRLFAMGCLAFTSCVTIISVKLQFIELHNKSIAAAIAILLSVGGWWIWNLALAGFYPKADPVYNVNNGLIQRFGQNPMWWLTLILIVLVVVLFETIVKILWASIKPTDVDIFQAYEQDREVRKRFEEAAADLLQQGWDRGTKKSSLDIAREAQEQHEREAQVQELLNRPRTMEEPSPGLRRRQSQPAGHSDIMAALPKSGEPATSRKSLDIGDLFSKGFGKVKKGERLV